MSPGKKILKYLNLLVKNAYPLSDLEKAASGASGSCGNFSSSKFCMLSKKFQYFSQRIKEKELKMEN